MLVYRYMTFVSYKIDAKLFIMLLVCFRISQHKAAKVALKLNKQGPEATESGAEGGAHGNCASGGPSCPG